MNTTPTQKQSESLKPCPFCGGEADFNFANEKAHNGTFEYWVECKDCQQCGKSSVWDEQDSARNQARDFWNTRAQPSETPVADKVREEIEAAHGCFSAAYTEGLHDVLANEENQDTGSLHDLVTRRLLYAMDHLQSAVSLIDQQGAPETLHMFNGKLYSRRQLEAENTAMRKERADLAARVEGLRKDKYLSGRITMAEAIENGEADIYNAALDAVLALIGKAGE